MNNIINIRSLSKRWYRYWHPSEWHHNDKIWRYVDIQRDEQGRLCEISCLGQVVEQISWQTLQTRQQRELVIVGSGLSALKINWDMLVDVDVLMVNGAVSLLDGRPHIQCHYYMVIDQGFVQDQMALMQPILQRPEVVFITTVFCLNKVYELLGRDGVKAQICILEERQKPVYQAKPSAEMLYQDSLLHPEQLYWQAHTAIGFGLDIQRGFVGGGTVVYPALQWAAAMAYRRVFLAGVDMKHFHQPRFYETEHNRLPTKLDADFKTVIEPSFALAAVLLQAKGIECLNLCVDSGLGDDIFQRVDGNHYCATSIAA
ncbi:MULTISPECIES: hypothetical protein [Vitreoscilla]|uniref:Uncharacterized protein n=1 Tax=Vitreoscilla stercoraria TaxID=61 RepID=A0ABY4E6U3_VITST|nr:MULTISPECIES: hypothetical protein [Vitreoscilla]AUZ04840.2 hypothetical protein ADP71_11870 [Vitreoscilla sp. C1]UOO91493.1 hypothetical protein LVJ81_07390 [Vitreoscilla stercoraria]